MRPVAQILKTEDGDDVKITISLSDHSDQMPDTRMDVLNSVKIHWQNFLKPQ